MATPAHLKQGEGHDGSGWSTTRIIVAVGAAVVIVAAGITSAVVLTRSPSTKLSGSTTGGHGGHTVSSAGPTGGSSTTSQPPAPLSVRSVTPKRAAKGVATNGTISIRFSHAVAANSPTPTLSPPILGRWSRQGDSMVFRPRAGYIPSTKERVTVAASTAAVEESRTVKLGHRYNTTFNVGTGSVLRLQQLLAELGYLPLTFTRSATNTSGSTPPASSSSAPTHKATTTAAVATSGLSAEPVSAAAISTNPTSGQFAWRYADSPPALRAQWQRGQANLVTKGAVMAFEGDHGLAVDGAAGPQVWTTLLKAVAKRQTDPRKYSYIMVNEEGTEQLRVWQAGSIAYTTLANTGVPGAATQQGTFAVETHLPTDRMIGTDVGGAKYNVVVTSAAYFNGGDAIHGYVRTSYGFPQSNGCVELSPPDAAYIFNNGDDWYGTLVTVS